MIHLSQAALHELKRLQAKQQSQTNFRLSVRPGGCGDWLYVTELVETTCPDDQLYRCNGIQVAIDRQALDYLQGMTLDYSEDLMGGGFRFHNPNAAKHCGCGNSFTLGAEIAQQLPLLETDQ